MAVLRMVFVLLLMVASGAAGFYVRGAAAPNAKAELKVDFPNVDPKWLPKLAPVLSLACAAASEANVFENLMPTAQAQANIGTDKLSLKFTEDGKGVLLLTAAAASAGHTDAGSPLVISYTDLNFIVAVRANDMNSDVLILNKNTLKAVWSNTGFNFGLWGESVLMQCR